MAILVPSLPGELLYYSDSYNCASSVDYRGISIGLPVGGTPEGCMYLLNHSKAQFILAEDHKQVDKIFQVCLHGARLDSYDLLVAQPRIH